MTSDATFEYERTRIRPLDCLSSAGAIWGDQYWLFVGMSLVALVLTQVASPILVGPAMCGVFLVFLTRMRGEPVKFELVFKGFDYFLESFLATLIMIGITILLVVPFFFLMIAILFATALGGEGDATFALLLIPTVFLIVLVQVVAQGLFIFVFPLIVDRGLSAWPATKLGVRAAWTHFWGVIGLLLINSIVMTVAFSCCFLPGLLVLPYCFGAMAIAYRRVFPDLNTVVVDAKPKPAGEPNQDY